MTARKRWSISGRVVAGIFVAGIVTTLLVFASDPVSESEMVSFHFPPKVITNPATEITETTATLQGTLDDMGDIGSVAVLFQWGKNEWYDNETSLQAMILPGTFSASLEDLKPDITYHFRAKAIGSEEVYGEDVTFTLK